MGRDDEDDGDIRVTVAVLKTKMDRLLEDQKSRAMREWGVMATLIGLLMTIIAKSQGWM